MKESYGKRNWEKLKEARQATLEKRKQRKMSFSISARDFNDIINKCLGGGSEENNAKEI